MNKLPEQDIFIIKTLASYTVINTLLEKEVIDKKAFNLYWEKLTEIEKVIIGYYLTEQIEISDDFTNHINDKKL